MNLNSLTLNEAKRAVIDGRCSPEDFAAYLHLWQTSAPRLTQQCHCAECNAKHRSTAECEGCERIYPEDCMNGESLLLCPSCYREHEGAFG